MRVNSWARGLKLIAVDGFLVKPLDFDRLIELLEA
jgi:hypothetical protein